MSLLCTYPYKLKRLNKIVNENQRDWHGTTVQCTDSQILGRTAFLGESAHVLEKKRKKFQEFFFLKNGYLFFQKKNVLNVKNDYTQYHNRQIKLIYISKMHF